MHAALVQPGVHTPFGSLPLLMMPGGTFELSTEGPGDASSVMVVPSAWIAASGLSSNVWQYGLQGLSWHVVELPPTANVRLHESTAALPAAAAGALTDDVPRAASMRHEPHLPPSQI